MNGRQTLRKLLSPFPKQFFMQIGINPVHDGAGFRYRDSGEVPVSIRQSECFFGEMAGNTDRRISVLDHEVDFGVNLWSFHASTIGFSTNGI